MTVVSIADKRKLAYVGSQPRTFADRDSDAWYTPEIYVKAAKDVMGRIDLDPFSSAEANCVIGATRFFSVNYSAFDRDWRPSKKHKPVSVWMNPPYSSNVISKAVNKLIEQYTLGNVNQAIVLTNNSTDTRWFNTLSQQCTAICFTNHRIAFESPDGKRISGNTRGQTFFYFGNNENAASFTERFSEFGWAISKVRGWR